jgi:AcrR family transcriptional regulator
MTYSGTNPTAKQSKELLANALAQLLSTKKFTQISIKEICEEAQVSRQTFYNLFDSKDDILRYYLEATMKTMFAPLWQKRDQSPDHLINVTIRYVETNRFFLRLLVENSLQSMFLQAIQSGITELTKNEPTDYSEFRKAFIA